MTWRSVHTRILVDHYRTCFLFYRDVLGIEPGFGNESSGYADFQLGEVTVALFDRHEMAEALGTPDDSAGAAVDRFALVFGVDDVDGAADELRARGVSMLAEPTDRPDWGIRTAQFRDPDGNLIEINAPLRSPS